MEPYAHCYRLRPYYRNVGVACTAFFLVMGVASTLLAAFNVDGSFPRPLLMAGVFAVFWSCFVLLGVWLAACYYRYRLHASDSVIEQVGVFRQRQVEWRLVKELKWRLWPKGGSVRLKTPVESMAIELGNFSTTDCEQLVSYLRHAISPESQVGWDEFHKHFEDTPEKRRRSRRVVRLLGWVFVAHAVAFTVAWAAGLGVQHLGYAVMNVVVAYYVMRTKSESTMETAGQTTASERVTPPP